MRRALLHFLILGALLFALDRWRPWRPAPAAARAAASADEMLLERALLDRVDRRDPVVQRRLLDDMSFLELDGDSPRALGDEAVTLDMHRRDVVVRRRLIEAMWLRLAGDVEEPSEDEIRRYLLEHVADYRQPPRFGLNQVFLRRDAAGAGDRAARLLARLRREHLDVPEIEALGDPGPWPSRLADKSRPAIDRLFGRDFGAAVERAATGEWIGPLSSPYGLHLVRVEERRAGGSPALEDVRGRVRAAIVAERRDARVRAAVEQERRNEIPASSGDGEAR
jgi:peptidyl-prolyl cis-trans isomerase C